MRLIASLIAFAALATAAQAQVCVTVDEKKDTLSAQERVAAKALAETSFQNIGVTTVPAPCSSLYTISNIRLGDAIVANISGPKGTRKAKAADISELDAVYDQMIRGLVTGEQSGTTRVNVTSAQERPKRVRADGFWNINVGTGYVMGSDVSEVPIGFGFGYRYELDQIGIDFTARLFIAAGNDEGDDGGVNGGLRLMGLYHFDGVASSSPYIGGGLGWGGTAAVFDDNFFSGGGLEGHIAAGYSFLRESTIRMYIQADAVIPFYNLEDDFTDLDGTTKQEDRYAPIVGLSFGIGWGR